MYPEVYGSMQLTGFEGGRLKVFLYDQWPTRSLTVTLKSPGDIVVSEGLFGPKEWSPLGLVPKEAVPLFYRESPSLIIRILAKYECPDGISHEPELTVGIRPRTPDSTSSKDFCVYFVPVPGRKTA